MSLHSLLSGEATNTNNIVFGLTIQWAKTNNGQQNTTQKTNTFVFMPLTKLIQHGNDELLTITYILS
jgi:hypothetical protein